MIRKLILFFLVFVSINFYSQNFKPQPKLVVGVVVDQMRADYIYRFWNRFGDGGFKRLVKDGFFCRNAHYNYVPTYTGPGHCSIYTGATPAAHGIIANEWFVKETGKHLYCAEDPSVKPIGTTNPASMMSPKNQLTTTLGDELKLLTNGRAKVFGVALKDRSSVLPVGHAANAAFWFDDLTGSFVSSSWYVTDLPQWLKKFNDKKLVKSYLDKGWNTLYPIETYTSSIADKNNYENEMKGIKPVFPYDYKALNNDKNFGIIKATPWGNSITKDIAIECLKAESLGKDEVPDMLCISFSSTDIIGHQVGIRAVEIEDVYLRLDKDLEELLNALDTEVGKDAYTLFLTADHAGADVPNYLKDMKIPAGLVNEGKLIADLKQFCFSSYGDSLVRSVSNQQVFLNEEKVTALKLDPESIEKAIAAKLVKMEGVAEAWPSSVLKYLDRKGEDQKSLAAAGYNYKRSGNIAFSYLPAWLDIGEKGTTHGSAYTYDTHVPLLFYGSGIKHGEKVSTSYITEIAPTISILLNMPFPNGCISQPIGEVLEK